MHFRSVNVLIRPRPLFPWSKQIIQVDGQNMFNIKRTYSLFSISTQVSKISDNELFVNIKQPRAHQTTFEVQIPQRTYSVRKVSYWHWECRCQQEVIMINRLSGIKCVLSQEGRQLAIMSLNTSLPFVEDRNTYIRVNSETYLPLSIAAALIVKGYGINFNTFLLNDPKLSPIRPVELV